jgi:hypothetical protein
MIKINPLHQLLFLNLYRVAIVDGFLDPSELRMLNRIGEERGVSVDEIQKIIRTPTQDNNIILSFDDKIQYLMDVSKIIISDLTIKDEELYLWDKIAHRILGEERKVDQLKKEIFKRVIEEHIKQQEVHLNTLKTHLLEELNDKVLDTIPGVVELPEGADPTPPTKQPPSIIMLGQFLQTKQQLRSLFKPIFNEVGITLTNRDFKFAIAKEYNKIKSGHKMLIKNALNGIYDILIYGPHPHNLTGNTNGAWETLLENTDTTVFGSFNSPNSNAKLQEYAKDFSQKWVESF